MGCGCNKNNGPVRIIRPQIEKQAAASTAKSVRIINQKAQTQSQATPIVTHAYKVNK